MSDVPQPNLPKLDPLVEKRFKRYIKEVMDAFEARGVFDLSRNEGNAVDKRTGKKYGAFRTRLSTVRSRKLTALLTIITNFCKLLKTKESMI